MPENLSSEERNVVDARGLSCPQPVMLARRAIEAGRLPVHVMVDSVTARENVRRMVEKAGMTVEIESTGEEFTLLISR